MLRSLKDLQEFSLLASDRELGDISDFLFDDFDWSIRYVVVKVNERDVLLSVHALSIPEGNMDSGQLDEGLVQGRRTLMVQVDTARLLQYPGFVPGRPLTREEEQALSDYFSWPRYWERDIPNTMPGDLTSIPLAEMEMDKEPVIPTTGDEQRSIEQNRLHSANEVFGHQIQARDGSAGKLSDFIVDDQNWNLDYLVVDTGGFLPGKKVLVSPQWIQEIDWDTSRILMDLSEDTIHNSPEYTSSAGITPDYWTNVRDYYGHDE